jgi:hypothetical protein
LICIVGTDTTRIRMCHVIRAAAVDQHEGDVIIGRTSARKGEPTGTGMAGAPHWGTSRRWRLLGLDLGAALLVSTGPSFPAREGPGQDGQSAATKSAPNRGVDALPEQRPAAPPDELWALLIGIEKYERMPHRRGWRTEQESGRRAQKNCYPRASSRWGSWWRA